MTPSGIEPATFRFVAQYLNHCATAVPNSSISSSSSSSNNNNNNNNNNVQTCSMARLKLCHIRCATVVATVFSGKVVNYVIPVWPTVTLHV
jgi:hypothetical protein